MATRDAVSDFSALRSPQRPGRAIRCDTSASSPMAWLTRLKSRPSSTRRALRIASRNLARRWARQVARKLCGVPKISIGREIKYRPRSQGNILQSRPYLPIVALFAGELELLVSRLAPSQGDIGVTSVHYLPCSGTSRRAFGLVGAATTGRRC